MRTVFAIAASLVLMSGAWADESYSVRNDGFGPVRVGMTKAEVSRALGEPIVRTLGAGDFECEYLQPAQHWKGVAFMFSRGRVARVDVREGVTKTAAGIRLDDEISKVMKTYHGQVEVTPHHYIPEPEGKYLTVKSANGKRAIRFETDGGRVATYYAGRFPEVEYVEGCL